MAKSILDIATLIERPKIAIDGELYEILSPDELSVIDHHRLASQGRRLDELMKQNSLSADDETELSQLLRDISDFIMVGVPDDVRAKLTDAHRTDISEVFTSLPLHKQLTAMLAAGAKGKSIGAKRPRGSKGSTAGRRTGGSTKRRSRSSRRTSK